MGPIVGLLIAVAVHLSSGEFTDPHCQGKQVLVHLFEWKWTDVATECERFLSKKGYCAVQVSPPNEHVMVTKEYQRPWWERYQPVSYKLHSRGGTEDQFKDMVTRCKNVGVRIIVDVVMNHMAGLGRTGTGTAGSSFNSDNLDFPGVPFKREHFNEKNKCPSGDGNVNNYGDPNNVRNCYLVGLTDLNQNIEYVRDAIAGYLNHLIDIGVSGFRIDAAKHMWPADISAIQKRVKDLPEGGKAFWAHEVIDQNDGAIKVGEYTPLGYVTEFRYCQKIAEGTHSFGALGGVVDYGWGMTPSANAFVFVDNHDNQRGHGGGGRLITHKTPRDYKFAQAFTLAYNYGFVRVMSSYFFGDDSDQGPPHNADFSAKDVTINADGTCGNGWVCEHRWAPIANMAAFRNTVVGTDVKHWYDQGDVVAFARGNKGFFVMAKQGHIDQTFQTGLPAGEYCDLIHDCQQKVTVDDSGNANIHIDNQEEPILAITTGGPTSPGGNNGGGATNPGVKTNPGVQTNPTVVQTNPTVVQTNPTVVQTNPAVGQTNPTVVQTNPTVVQTNPAVGQTNPAVVQTNPTVVQTNPTVVQTNPAVGQTNPTVVQTNPTVVQTNPTVVQTNPAVGQTNPAAGQTNPTVVQTNPAVGKTNPTVGQTNPTVVQTNPPVGQNTSAPVVTSTVTLVTTSAPVVTSTVTLVYTSAPVVTSTVTLVTTSAPLVTSTVSLVTTPAPVVTTTVPLATTSAPVVTTTVPLVTTPAPVVTSTVSLVTTPASVVPTTVPLVTTPAPVVTSTVAPVTTDWQHTVILIERRTNPGQDVFIRGGLDHGHMTGCTNTASTTNPCSIPIRHRDLGHGPHYNLFNTWSTGDNFLDWYGAEPGQGWAGGRAAEGTPALWTTNKSNKPEYTKYNTYGDHYWMVDVDMDCSKTLNGFFEFKSLLNGGWEGNIHGGVCTGAGAAAPPYYSINHMARCGYLNVYHWGAGRCEVVPLL